MTNRTPALASAPSTAAIATTRLVLRDGSSAGVRLASSTDRDAMRLFFQDLSRESRRLRFLDNAEASDTLIDQLCNNADPMRTVTLVVYRHRTDGIRLVGVGSYFSKTAIEAEVAFAVDDRFHGKGIATALLERLARIATEHGFQSFDASVLFENKEMLDVFRDSGFGVRTTMADGCVDVRFSLAPSPDSVGAADERDRLATIASLRAILKPRAVAVIGASRTETNLGRRVFDALLSAGFHGSVYPVNPAVDQIKGIRCYRSARELPDGVDLAVIAVPRNQVLAVVDDCAVIGVKGIVVISAGFAEVGEPGRILEQKLVEKVRGYGMRMLGPNCMGVMNSRPEVRLNASFAESLPAAGNIVLASQSGGLGLAILGLAAERQLGLSTFVSLGNKGDISGNDLLQYGESDQATSVILFYLESFGNPRRFARLARRVSRKKPIVVVRAGRTPAGSRAAASHTAGLAASELAVDTLFRQSGVIRADTINEMFDIAACLDAQPLPPGRRVAILTNAGGPGILAADACSSNGLLVPELSEAMHSILATLLPGAASIGNPVDMAASAGPDEYRRSIEALLAADDVDAVIAVYTAIDSQRTPEMLAAIEHSVVAGRAGGSTKPVLVCTMATARVAPLHGGAETIPVYAFPEQAARALGKVAAYADWRNEPAGTFSSLQEIGLTEARALCRDIVGTRGDTWLTHEELGRLLQAFGLRLAPGVIARTADEAARMARLIGYPVVAKIVSSRALHKTELGGVRLDLANEQAVRAAFTEMSERACSMLGENVDGVLLQPMFAEGIETIVGLTEDPHFGALVAFGLGGVNVDVFRDVAFRIAPLTDRDADDLLHSIRGFPLLLGHRGHQPADLDALREIILRVSYLGEQVPELLELDLNPVIALAPGHGCEIVDARARVGPAPARTVSALASACV